MVFKPKPTGNQLSQVHVEKTKVMVSEWDKMYSVVTSIYYMFIYYKYDGMETMQVRPWRRTLVSCP